MATTTTNGFPEMEPFDEDSVDLSDLQEKYTADNNKSLDNIIVLYGLPIIPKDKLQKLVDVLHKKLLSSTGKYDYDMPFNNDKSVGAMFISYTSAEDAKHAIKKLDARQFDAKHKVYADLISDIEVFANYDKEEHTPPPPEEYHPTPNLVEWLSDPMNRDQFVTFKGDTVSTYWNKKSEAPELTVEEKQRFPAAFVAWSPKGNYLATAHNQGVILWGGKEMSRITRFEHRGILCLDFSPSENFLVTFSPEPIQVGGPFKDEDAGKQIAIWNVKTGELCRTFSVNVREEQISEFQKPTKKLTWPEFKFTSDDKYTARISTSQTTGSAISVYETSSMSLLDKKSIKIDGIQTFDWAPFNTSTKVKERNYYLSYWTPEVQNKPATVAIMNIPEKTVVRTKNLFNVNDCSLYWQSAGDYLAVRVERLTKSKKSTFTNLEIFRMNAGRDIPVEVIELKDTVTKFAWEPRGERFAILHEAAGAISQGKVSLSFYGNDKTKGNFRLIKAYPNKNTDSLFWAPNGRFMVAIPMTPPSNFELEFWDLEYEGDKKDFVDGVNANVVLMGTAEHYGVTDIEWDPSGRFLATSCSVWRNGSDNGYKIWDFKGAQLQDQHLNLFKQFLWRPRPESTLPESDKKWVRKNLKELGKKFEEEDALEASAASRELIESRKKILAEWRQWTAAAAERVRQARIDAGLPAEEEEEEVPESETEVVEDQLEEVIEETEEIVDAI